MYDHMNGCHFSDNGYLLSSSSRTFKTLLPNPILFLERYAVQMRGRDYEICSREQLADKQVLQKINVAIDIITLHSII